MIYQAYAIKSKFVADGDVNKDFWKKSSTARLDYFIGDKPAFIPNVETKIAYDEDGILVLFVVNDCFVKAVHGKYQSNVWKDSCVELFFTPGDDAKCGYFNLEMNCGGTALFHFNKDGESKNIASTDFEKVDIYHSMPKIVKEEIEDPVKWIIEYKIPYKILEKYTKVTRPTYGVSWLINIYKCADESTNPHWLTWSKISYPKPNFHLPEFFGKIKFK